MNAPIAAQTLAAPAQTDRFSTHTVKNQAAFPFGFNAFDDDVVLQAAITRDAPWAAAKCAGPTRRRPGRGQRQGHGRPLGRRVAGTGRPRAALSVAGRVSARCSRRRSPARCR